MRKLLSLAIHLAGLAGGLVAMWQMVRFCQGLIGTAQPFGLFASFLTKSFGEPPAGFLTTVCHYVFGVMSWLAVTMLVLACSEALGHIVARGWQQFVADARAAQQEAARLRKIEDARERRRAARARQNGSGFSLTTLLIGAVIGSIFF